MAGIYIHIPFCKQACTYCNFHFSVNTSSHSRILKAIIKEISSTEVAEKKINTIYFGGGTPSVVPFNYIKEMLGIIRDRFDVAEDAEITLEANPDDIVPGTAAEWRKSGINRLSLGIQSFNDEELKWMNRAHSAANAIQSLRMIREEGFHNFSADLIYGSPLQNSAILEQNIEMLLLNEVPHISAYALTVEPRTALQSFIEKGKAKDVDQGMQSDFFLLLMDRLGKNGYLHYEISNFCEPGMHSRHNSSYWKGDFYYGFGPGAHSYDGSRVRKWNVSNNALYASLISNDQPAYESETLTETQLANERIMIALRTAAGLDSKEIEKILPGSSRKIISGIQRYLDTGKVQMTGGRYVLTDEGKLFADGIAAGLFL